ncbi:bifunctional UDP-sugar hydrolase/5'-nucleotidase [Seleniivibrio woodruffii]|uniref:bifunctional metallophosphatase/5'-nucleotidase n=1 Tax=Seleniivibrio woodruffii TaxID=1078050 RepID=UPI0026F03FF2|nr:5'-nucleotidase C-terminal domain-containing protein [Seleniivibrio woodruffii]
MFDVTRRSFVRSGIVLGAGLSLGLTGCSSDDSSGETATEPATGNSLKVSETTPSGSAFDSMYVLNGTPAIKAYAAMDSAVKTKEVSALAVGSVLNLSVFHFNDFHHRHVVTSATKGNTRYMAQMMKIINGTRYTENDLDRVMLVSGGDDHIGTSLDELMGTDTSTFVMSPAYKAYSAAKLDFAVLGNHEYDKGSSVLKKMISDNASFPVLSANQYGSTILTDEYVHVGVIGIVKGVRIGVIGITTPEETKTGLAEDAGLAFGGVMTTLKNVIPAIKSACDFIMIISHVGFNGTDANNTRHVIPEGDIEIATYMGSIGVPSIVIGGHTHSVLNTTALSDVNVVNGVPIFQAGSWGAYLGKINLKFEKTSEKLNVSVSSASLYALKPRDKRVASTADNYSSYEQDSDVDTAFQTTVIDPMLVSLSSKLTEVIGSTSDDAVMSTETTIADRYIGECAMANFMNDAIVARSKTFPGGEVDFAVFNSSGVAAGVPLNAQLTFNDWYAVMPYADIIRIIEMTGQQIKDMLISNAKRIVRSEETTVDVSGFISRGYLHFSSGIKYTISKGADATAATARDISLHGYPIDTVLSTKFRVGFSDYIAGGNEGWKGAEVGAGLPTGIIGFNIKALTYDDTGLIYRNELIEYIRTVKTVSSATGAVKDGRVTVSN